MAPQPSDMSVDRLWTDLQIPGDLAVGHASGGLHDDLGVEVWSSLPIGSGEGLRAEAAFAGLAGKPLDPMWGLESPEVANLLKWPRIAVVIVVFAVRVGAEGRGP